MNWDYNAIQKEHTLFLKQTKLAAIQIKAMKNGKFKVKTLIDMVYYGHKIQKMMEGKKKDWICYRKKLKSEQDVEKYIAIKKNYVQKFIESREKEI